MCRCILEEGVMMTQSTKQIQPWRAKVLNYWKRSKTKATQLKNWNCTRCCHIFWNAQAALIFLCCHLFWVQVKSVVLSAITVKHLAHLSRCIELFMTWPWYKRASQFMCHGSFDSLCLIYFCYLILSRTCDAWWLKMHIPVVCCM